MADMPTDIAYGKVVGRFLLAVGDSADGDTLPDAVAPTGMKVKFAPKQSIFKTTTPLATVIASSIECTVDTDGHMKDTAGNVGVWLIAGVYTVTYSGASLASHEIVVAAENDATSPVHLTTALPAAQPVSPTQYTELDSRITLLDGRLDSLEGAPAGGGGSAPIGLTQLYNSTVTQSSVTGGSRARFAGFLELVQQGSAFGITTDPAIPGWAYDEEGWYQFNLRLWLGFTAGATALPDFVRVSCQTWAGMQIDQEYPCTPPDYTLQFGSFRQVHGASLTITSPAYYGPGLDLAPMADQPNTVELGWPGDATLIAANGAAVTNALRVNVTRLS
jgi:hypothetical protein